MRCQLSARNAEVRALRATVMSLRTGYADAIEDISDWAAYASDYFREKHDINGTLKDHRQTLADALLDPQGSPGEPGQGGEG
jgi:hypothetical protein